MGYVVPLPKRTFAFKVISAGGGYMPIPNSRILVIPGFFRSQLVETGAVGTSGKTATGALRSYEQDKRQDNATVNTVTPKHWKATTS